MPVLPRVFPPRATVEAVDANERDLRAAHSHTIRPRSTPDDGVPGQQAKFSRRPPPARTTACNAAIRNFMNQYMAPYASTLVDIQYEAMRADSTVESRRFKNWFAPGRSIIPGGCPRQLLGRFPPGTATQLELLARERPARPTLGTLLGSHTHGPAAPVQSACCGPAEHQHGKLASE